VKATIPLSDPSATLYYGVNRTLELGKLSGYRKNASSADGDLLQYLVNFAAFMQRANAIQPGRTYTYVLHTSRFADIVNIVGNSTQYQKMAIGMDGKPSATIGYAALKVATPAGNVEIMGDPDWDDQVQHLLNFECWELLSMGPVPRTLMLPGQDQELIYNADSMRTRVGWRAQPACYAPGFNGCGTLTALL
jgi:hypothetical protein